ncbi:unnamed protein product [Amoebophrya sp. A25]|nr:unnamed protein product [Amoebophrya sp. A25]|eukprot:GSA25T00013093001.1
MTSFGNQGEEDLGDSEVRTYAFQNEDHTLGNVLRYALNKHRDVDGAGYNIPHPSEQILNLWVQTRPGTNVDVAVRESLENVQDMCDHLSSAWHVAVRDWEAKKKTEQAASASADDMEIDPEATEKDTRKKKKKRKDEQM